MRWQVYRRIARRGLVRVEVSQGDRVRSKVLDAWLRAVGSGDAVRVRLARGVQGDDLFPTEAEAERDAKEQALAAKEQALVAKEQALVAKEQALAAKEQERARRLRVEAENARLRSLLAKKSVKRKKKL